MSYYLISRLGEKNGGLERFPFAITESEDLVIDISANYQQPMNDWVGNNISGLTEGSVTMQNYFDLYPDCFEISLETNNIDKIKLPIIKNIQKWL